jgi:predicted Zn-dependent peptidase
MLMSVAGAIDWPKLCRWVEKLFGDWNAPAPHQPTKRPRVGGIYHVNKESAQSHITLGHAAATAGSDQYYPARVAETILSGGMSGRLFTEVREKRGLVYHVSCRYHSLQHYAGMFTYAGTSGDRAQQTLDVTVGELRRLGQGVSDAELARARTQLKSALVMQGESTSARASALVGDWHHLRRLRSLEEISEAIDNVTSGDVLEYTRQYPARDFTLLTIGPAALDTKSLNG